MANIRTARRSGLVLRGGRNIRSTFWGDVAGTITIIGGPSGSALLNVTGAGLLALRPVTVIRVRGYWHLQSDQAAAAEDQGAALGMAIVSDQAAAVGITAVPTPTTDRSSDKFFVYQSLMSSRGAGTVDSELGVGEAYDSKAMRRMEDGSQLVVVLESEVAGLTLGIAVRHVARILIKLH